LARFVDTSGIVDHHHLNCLFIILYRFIFWLMLDERALEHVGWRVLW